MSVSDESVVVAMSGGVDSSVAAALLLDEGREVTGAFLCLRRFARGAAASGRCCSPQDAADARRVADILGIDLVTLPVSDAFEPIIDDFVSEYARGRTPNPCIHCNARIKFAGLFDLAGKVGAGRVATGHHARMVRQAGRAAIARAKARDKDQSYALLGLPRGRLGRILLPIGELEGKEQVRRIAREMGLPVHDKPDSQDVCFVPEGGHAALLESQAPEALRGGPIVDAGGATLGTHDGYGRFTIGQRRGLRVAAGVPMYVTRIDPATATVTLGGRDELLSRHLSASGANWHRDVPERFEATVQIRYNHAGAKGQVRITGEGTFEVRFDEPVAAVTPGQAAVAFEGECLLGGGWIDSPEAGR